MPCSGVHHGFMSCILVCVHVCVSVLVHGGTSGYFLSYSLTLTEPEALPIPPSPPPPAHFPPASIRNIKGVCFVSFYAYWCCLHVYLCPRYVSVEARRGCWVELQMVLTFHVDSRKRTVCAFIRWAISPALIIITFQSVCVCVDMHTWGQRCRGPLWSWSYRLVWVALCGY